MGRVPNEAARVCSKKVGLFRRIGTKFDETLILHLRRQARVLSMNGHATKQFLSTLPKFSGDKIDRLVS